MPERMPGNPYYPPGVRERDISPPDPIVCSECNGRGYIRKGDDETETCNRCDGEGAVYEE